VCTCECVRGCARACPHTRSSQGPSPAGSRARLQAARLSSSPMRSLPATCTHTLTRTLPNRSTLQEAAKAARMRASGLITEDAFADEAAAAAAREEGAEGNAAAANDPAAAERAYQVWMRQVVLDSMCVCVCVRACVCVCVCACAHKTQKRGGGSDCSQPSCGRRARPPGRVGRGAVLWPMVSVAEGCGWHMGAAPPSAYALPHASAGRPAARAARGGQGRGPQCMSTCAQLLRAPLRRRRPTCSASCARRPRPRPTMHEHLCSAVARPPTQTQAHLQRQPRTAGCQGCGPTHEQRTSTCAQLLRAPLRKRRPTCSASCARPPRPRPNS